MKLLFTSNKIGELTLKNRSIRAAAFEGMSKDHKVSDDLIDYHSSVAKGGVAMTTIAYASVSKDGLSFTHQLLINEAARPGLMKLSEAIHSNNAKASIQLVHTGNMAKKSISGKRQIAPSSKFNLYGPTWPRKMNDADIKRVADDFGRAVKIVKESGFDAVEIHAGHGYLISQFLSPFTNKRKDKYGGSIQNRSRFLKEVMHRVREAAGDSMAVLVKMNVSDGFESGYTQADALYTAQLIESSGADAIVLSGGFVSKTPMYILRGKMPIKVMSKQIQNPIAKIMVRIFGPELMSAYPFREGYFIEAARYIVNKINIPLVALGGMNSRNTIERSLSSGFDFVAIARALIHDPDFIRKLQMDEYQSTLCDTCNYCVAVINSGKMRCYQNEGLAKETSCF